MTNQSIVNTINNTLASFPQVKLAILFGSYARGEERGDSDVDIGIAADRVLTFEEIEDIRFHLSESCGRAVDLIDLEKKQEPILTQVLSKGVLLFCHDRNQYAELIKTMWYDQADFMPLRNRILKERREKWINS